MKNSKIYQGIGEILFLIFIAIVVFTPYNSFPYTLYFTVCWMSCLLFFVKAKEELLKESFQRKLQKYEGYDFYDFKNVAGILTKVGSEVGVFFPLSVVMKHDIKNIIKKMEEEKANEKL
jgi:hypothetical protein